MDKYYYVKTNKPNFYYPPKHKKAQDIHCFPVHLCLLKKYYFHVRPSPGHFLKLTLNITKIWSFLQGKNEKRIERG